MRGDGRHVHDRKFVRDPERSRQRHHTGKTVQEDTGPVGNLDALKREALDNHDPGPQDI
jgi:hypothetical protein